MMMIVRLSNMAGKKIVKGSEEWQMFQDFWKLAQEIWEPEDTDEYWESVDKKTKVFYEKYHTLSSNVNNFIRYARGFAIGIINALDSVYKERKKTEHDTEKRNESGISEVNAAEKRTYADQCGR